MRYLLRNSCYCAVSCTEYRIIRLDQFRYVFSLVAFDLQLVVLELDIVTESYISMCITVYLYTLSILCSVQCMQQKLKLCVMLMP